MMLPILDRLISYFGKKVDDGTAVAQEQQVRGAFEAFEKRAKVTAQSDAWQKASSRVRKDMLSDAEVGIFLFTQATMWLHKHTGDEKKALDAMQGFIDGARQSMGGK